MVRKETWKERFYLFCAFWLMVALLELGQDYISAQLNGNQFYLADSLLFKVFWLFFIPISWGYVLSLEKTEALLSNRVYFVVTGLLLLVATFFHLLLFSLFLLIVSTIIHAQPWDLQLLITQKLSTRLYIVLVVNILITIAYFWFKHKNYATAPGKKEYADVLPVKIGTKSIIVNTESINWIKSEGAYLSLCTSERRYIITRTLKSLMQELNPRQFIRIHRSTIVNIDLISTLKSRLNGDYDVVLHDGTELRLSRNYVKPLKGILL